MLGFVFVFIVNFRFVEFIWLLCFYVGIGDRMTDTIDNVLWGLNFMRGDRL